MERGFEIVCTQGDATDGYRWVDDTKEGRCLIPVSTRTSRSSNVTIAEGLFLSAAEVGDSEDLILDFHNRWGALISPSHGLRASEHHVDQSWVKEDTIICWHYPHIALYFQELHAGVQLWHILLNQDIENLRKWVSEQQQYDFRSSIDFDIEDDVSETLAFAQSWLEQTVSYHISRSHASGYSSVGPISPFDTRTRGFISYHPMLDGFLRIFPTTNEHFPDATYRFVLAYESLGAALWAQFSQAIVEKQSFYRCEICGKFNKRISTRPKRFCSTACKSRYHRNPKEFDEIMERKTKEGSLLLSL